MSFTPDILKSKLAAVNETQESITSLSQWIMFHKRHAKTSAEVWAEYTASEAPVKAKLALVYLANEVVQQCRARRKDEFVQAFASVLPETIEEVYGSVDKAVKDRINRVVKVWAERSVLPQEVQQDIEARLGSETALAAAVPELLPVTRHVTQYRKSRDSLLKSAESSGRQLSEFLAGDHSSALASLQKVSRLEHILEQCAQLAKKAQDSKDAAVVALRELAGNLEAEVVNDLASERQELQAKKTQLLSLIGDEDEDPSPDVEPSTPEGEDLAPVPEPIEQDDEYVPSVYTAKDAEANYAANDDGDGDVVTYAASSDEEEEDDEPEAKKPKLDLDPKLASFLASMSGK